MMCFLTICEHCPTYGVTMNTILEKFAAKLGNVFEMEIILS